MQANFAMKHFADDKVWETRKKKLKVTAKCKFKKKNFPAKKEFNFSANDKKPHWAFVKKYTLRTFRRKLLCIMKFGAKKKMAN